MAIADLYRYSAIRGSDQTILHLTQPHQVDQASDPLAFAHCLR